LLLNALLKKGTGLAAKRFRRHMDRHYTMSELAFCAFHRFDKVANASSSALTEPLQSGSGNTV